MSQPNAEYLLLLAKRMSDALMTAALCSQEIRSGIQSEPGDEALPAVTANTSPTPRSRPLLDESTFSVVWHGTALHLGHTRSFWLLERLSRCPNQYVNHAALLTDVWDDEMAAVETLRSIMRHLRRRLNHGGMSDLATAIRGHRGHYILEV